RPRRGARDAVGVALAARAVRLHGGALRDAPRPALRGGRGLRVAHAARSRCLALEGAPGRVNAVPHSTEATSAFEVARVERGRLARPNGWWGMAVFVATEATLFGTLVGTYFFLRFDTAKWPPPGVPEPKLTLPIVLTGILVATSIPVQLSVRSASRGRLGAARTALFLAA